VWKSVSRASSTIQISIRNSLTNYFLANSTQKYCYLQVNHIENQINYNIIQLIFTTNTSSKNLGFNLGKLHKYMLDKLYSGDFIENSIISPFILLS
jgi:predicted choloylglycine hydrolase